ncbi:MAG: acyltransferase [Flagellimonas sp.]
MKKFIKALRSFFFTVLAKYFLGDFRALIKANGYTRLTKNTKVGKNVHFNGMIIQGHGKCCFGNNFHSGPKCRIITINHDYDNGESIPYGKNHTVKNVRIEDNVWLGYNVLILGGVEIGEGAIIQAGSVVVKSIPKYSIAGGHPAKVFSQRNIEHYERLKKQGRFN